jgi:hypothetical protein
MITPSCSNVYVGTWWFGSWGRQLLFTGPTNCPASFPEEATAYPLGLRYTTKTLLNVNRIKLSLTLNYV